MACPNCHREIPPDSRFCSWCGAQVGPGAVTSAAAMTSVPGAPPGREVRPIWHPSSEGWRSATAGWVLLHIVLGLLMGIADVLLAAAVVAVAGRSVEPSLAVGLIAPLTLLVTAGGWLLFVYVPARAAARGVAFASLATAAFAMLLVTALATQPAG